MSFFCRDIRNSLVVSHLASTQRGFSGLTFLRLSLSYQVTFETLDVAKLIMTEGAMHAVLGDLSNDRGKDNKVVDSFP
jgi:hypothetical protein